MGAKEHQAKAREWLLRAKAIVDLAEAEGRELTTGENGQVESYLKNAKQERGNADLSARLDELGVGIGGTVRMGDFMSGASRGLKGRPDGRSWSKAVREYAERVGSKALMTPSGSVEAPSPTRILAPLGDKVETVLQLIPSEPLGGTDGFSFLQEVERTHQAAVVAASALKPTSTYSLERKEDRARVIAHLSEPIPRAWLSDVRGLERYLDMVLREGVQLALESEVINGDGTGEHFTGLLATSGINIQAYDTSILTTTRKAITTLELLSIVPGAFVFNPSDWETIELLEDGNQAYKLSTPPGPDAGQSLPVDRARRRLWGLPVALSTGLTAGTGILADFAGSTALFERDMIRIDWSEAAVVDGTSAFEKNLVVFRGEGRWGFAVTRPSGVVEVELTAGS